MVGVLRLVVAIPVLASLVAGLAGGLLRAGVPLPGAATAGWLGAAAVAHAFLMICTFMGTVIAIERAVAVKTAWAWAGPVASATAGIATVCGAPALAHWLVVAASAMFVAVNALVVTCQRAAHTVLLLVAAVAWCIGSLLHALDPLSGAAVSWWFLFLVLTIAAERLEMTRLMRRRPAASHALHGIVAGLALGAAASSVSPRWGGVLYGASLAGLALWLLHFDIARRTVWAHGLSRYMAACLLLGYAWLAVAGAAWVATSLGAPFRDAALHALALGFVFGMVLAHAPVILPAIARVKVMFGWGFYVPLALLQASLLWRVAGGLADVRALSLGAAGNAVAIGAFALTVAGAAMAWRVAERRPR
jgi:hypothetical protein